MMNKSESIKEICKALIVFSVKVDTIRKDAKNPFFKSSYATLSNIIDSIKEPLIESGLSYVQFPNDENGLTTMLMHESGEWISSDYIMAPVKNDPQGRGSAITYQRRYALASVLGLNIDDDDDGNKATYGAGTPEKPEQEWLNKGTESFNKALEYMKKEDADINIIKKKYRLSKEVETLLLKAKSK